MKKILLSVLVSSLSLSLIGCSSIPKEQVNARIGDWKGQNIDELIKYWGLPSNQRQVANKFYAEWLNQSSEPGNMSVSVGGGRSSRHSGIGIGLSLFDLGGNDDACSRLVTYDETNIVSEISWQGTNDYCYEVTPDLNKIQENQKQVQASEE